MKPRYFPLAWLARSPAAASELLLAPHTGSARWWPLRGSMICVNRVHPAPHIRLVCTPQPPPHACKPVLVFHARDTPTAARGGQAC